MLINQIILSCLINLSQGHKRYREYYRESGIYAAGNNDAFQGGYDGENIGAETYYYEHNYCMKFMDDFNVLNTDVWQHDITLWGGGNNEFQWYTDNPKNSYIEDGKLHITPTFTIDNIEGNSYDREDYFMNRFEMDLSKKGCTSSAIGNDTCYKKSNRRENTIVNPIQSALFRSKNKLTLKYGKIDVRLKLPKGDWLWPAVWLLPNDEVYGGWPRSGEIDLVESRGNSRAQGFNGEGREIARSTLHWGPRWDNNGFYLTSGSKYIPPSDDGFHTYTLTWTPDGIFTYVDDVPIFEMPFRGPAKFPKGQAQVDPAPDVAPQRAYTRSPEPSSFWELGNFNSTEFPQNIWNDQVPHSPFDQDFYIIMNLAVGGTTGFFGDNLNGKPWANSMKQGEAAKNFWLDRQNWEPTWGNEWDRSLIVDYIKVFDMC